MGEKYIYTIANLTKKHGSRAVLSDIWLAFYPGAKIGVLGRNGSGKSTLLRIMAGEDREFDGHAELTAGFTVALLPQEPQLDPGFRGPPPHPRLWPCTTRGAREHYNLRRCCRHPTIYESRASTSEEDRDRPSN